MSRAVLWIMITVVLPIPLPSQESRPASRPSNPPADDLEARSRDPEWGDDAPGTKVVPVKLLPITRAPYSKPDSMKYQVKGHDLVIGIGQGQEARAYPVLMLGGP